MHIDTSTSHHDNAATSPEIHKTDTQKLNQMLAGVGLGNLSASEDSNTNTSSSLSEEPMEMERSDFSRRWGERKQFLSDFINTNKFFRQKINKHKLSKQLIQKSKNKSQRLREKQKQRKQITVGAKAKGNSMTLKKEEAKNLLAIIPYKPFSLPKRAPVTNPPSFVIPKLPKELPLTFLHPFKRASEKIPLGNEHQTPKPNDLHNENEAQQRRENSVHTKSNSATAEMQEMHSLNSFAGIYFIVEEKVLKKQVHFFENLKDFC